MSGYWTPGPGEPAAELRGRPLRYLLVRLLAEAGRPLTVGELVGACRAEGVQFRGRPSKLVSDAIRWEVRRGRVRRVARGRYALDHVPDSTMRWIRHRVAQTRWWLAWMRTSPAMPDDPGGYGQWDWQGGPSWVPPWPRWYLPVDDPAVHGRTATAWPQGPSSGAVS